jgi:hypothetical protein
MEEMENIIDEATDCFEDKMKQLFDEVGGEALGVTDQMDWSGQACFAAEVLRSRLIKAVEAVEAQLHGGYFRYDD